MNFSRLFFQINIFPAKTFPTAPNSQLIQSVFARSNTMLVGVRKNAQQIPLAQLCMPGLYSLLPGKHIRVHACWVATGGGRSVLYRSTGVLWTHSAALKWTYMWFYKWRTKRNSYNDFLQRYCNYMYVDISWAWDIGADGTLNGPNPAVTVLVSKICDKQSISSNMNGT